MSEQDFWQIAVIVWAGSVIWLLNDIRQTMRHTHKLVAHHVTRRWPEDLGDGHE